MSTYQQLFHLIDVDGSGNLSIEEVTGFCQVLPNPPATAVVARLFAQADTDKSGGIDEMEFSALCEGIKMLVNMTESDMVDAYAVSEIRRLYQYLCTTNGKTMRRDELRKALFILSNAMSLPGSDQLIDKVMLDFNFQEYEFETFKAILQQLSPNSSFCNIASVFKEEERRRKDKLNKTRSIFELAIKKSKTAEVEDTGPCKGCEALRTQLEAATELLKDMDELKEKLEQKDKDITTLAAAEVEHMMKTKKVEAELAEAIEALSESRKVAEEHDEAKQKLEARLSGLQKALTAADDLKSQHESDQDTIAKLKNNATEMQEIVDRAQAKTSRIESEMKEVEEARDSFQRRMKDKDIEVLKLQGLLDELRGTREESKKMEALVREIKQRCVAKEDEAARRMAEADRAVERCNVRELDFEQREGALSEKFNALLEYEQGLHDEWDGAIEQARLEQEQLADALAVRELELIQNEAELKVKEQMVDAKIRQAESTSLPERERRLRLLQQIEKDLCDRERSLRQGETDYLRTLVHPEIQSLRERNDELSKRVLDLNGEMNTMSEQHRREIQRHIAEHNSQLRSSVRQSIGAPAANGMNSSVNQSAARGGAPLSPGSAKKRRTRSTTLTGLVHEMRERRDPAAAASPKADITAAVEALNALAAEGGLNSASPAPRLSL